MGYHAFLYAFSITLSLTCGAFVLKKYRNPSGLFFFLFTVFASLWFFLYFLFFAGIDNVETLLFLSRLNFWVGLGATYGLLFFVYFFDSKASKIWSPKIFYIIVPYLLILALHAGTDLIVSGLSYSPEERVYREIPWKWYLLNAALHGIGMVSLAFVFFRQIRKQAYLNRIRLKRILLSGFLFMAVCLVLQLVLPTFNIWILEKEIVLFFLLFTAYAFSVLRRYYFSSGYGIGKFAIAVVSLMASVVFINGIERWYPQMDTGSATNYWSILDRYFIVDATLVVLFFFGSYTVLRKTFLGNAHISEVKTRTANLERTASHMTSLPDLNECLRKGIGSIFKTKFCEVRTFGESSEKTELQKYFENALSEKIFINDVVFIEEKKTRFDREKLLQEIPEEAFLILPIFRNDGKENVAVFIIGTKLFWDFYSTEEIRVLKDFAFFLELHLRHMKTYGLLEELSINLDQKVDEKTIEYNNLINRQKEFISVISHEIKAPVSNAIFQADGLIDDLERKVLREEDIKKELELLNSQLLRAGELISKLFSVQYFDTRAVTLFKEKIRISSLLKTEYEIYSHLNPHVRFVDRIDPKIGFVSLDRIQFQQVLSNLLQNAVKFLGKKNPAIIVEARRENGKLLVSIEDSGSGFQWADVESLFERYQTGGGKMTGLWMGLYLCKKIVEMHGGTIRAGTWEELGWAKFEIKIPLD